MSILGEIYHLEEKIKSWLYGNLNLWPSSWGHRLPCSALWISLWTYAILTITISGLSLSPFPFPHPKKKLSYARQIEDVVTVQNGIAHCNVPGYKIKFLRCRHANFNRPRVKNSYNGIKKHFLLHGLIYLKQPGIQAPHWLLFITKK